MSRTGALILIGILTIITPYSGLPVATRSVFTVIFGAVVVSIGLSLRARETKVLSAPQSEEPPQQAIG